MRIHETRTITESTVDGSTKNLLVHIRTQFDENIHMIGLEIEGEPDLLRINWKHPFTVHKKMVEAIVQMHAENPWIIDKLWFEAEEPSRARLNARSFRRKGYQVHHEFGNFYSIPLN